MHWPLWLPILRLQYVRIIKKTLQAIIVAVIPTNPFIDQDWLHSVIQNLNSHPQLCREGVKGSHSHYSGQWWSVARSFCVRPKKNCSKSTVFLVETTILPFIGVYKRGEAGGGGVRGITGLRWPRRLLICKWLVCKPCPLDIGESLRRRKLEDPYLDFLLY